MKGERIQEISNDAGNTPVINPLCEVKKENSEFEFVECSLNKSGETFVSEVRWVWTLGMGRRVLIVHTKPVITKPSSLVNARGSFNASMSLPSLTAVRCDTHGAL